MSDTYRYRYGDSNSIDCAVLTAQAIALGDMVAIEGSPLNLQRAEDETFQSAVSTPSAPAVTDSAVTVGSALTNAATGVKVSYQFPWGEGTLSAAGSVTPTAHASIIVAAIALPTNATGVNCYVETSAGSGTYKLAATGFGESILINTYGGGRVPPTAAPQTALALTQYNFAQSFVGVAMQRKLANVATPGTGGGPANFLRVATDGVFDFACTSATFQIGDLVGPDNNSGTALYSQQVVAVTSRALAIGTVVVGGTGLTTVRVRLRGRVKGVVNV